METVSLLASFTLENAPNDRLKVRVFRFGEEIAASSFDDTDEGYSEAFDFGQSEIELYNGASS